MQQDSVAQAASGLRGSEERVRAGLSFMERAYGGAGVGRILLEKKAEAGAMRLIQTG